METLVLVLHVVIALSMVVIILLQQGKGADAGASFGGGGASSTMFGSLGAMPFLTKLTATLAVMFFITSLTLAVLANKGSKDTFNIEVPEVVSGEEDIPSVKVNNLELESDLPQLDAAEVGLDALEDDVPGETGAEEQPVEQVVE